MREGAAAPVAPPAGSLPLPTRPDGAAARCAQTNRGSPAPPRSLPSSQRRGSYASAHSTDRATRHSIVPHAPDRDNPPILSEPDAPPHPQSGPDNGAGPPPFLSCPEGYHKSLPDGATTGFVNLSLFSHWRELR